MKTQLILALSLLCATLPAQQAASDEPHSTGDDQLMGPDYHPKSGVVDETFVQFYPTLLPIAKAKGTLRRGTEK